MNWADVRQAYKAVNGEEAAKSVDSGLYAKAAKYGNLNGYEKDDADVLIALDVLRMDQSGDLD